MTIESSRVDADGADALTYDPELEIGRRITPTQPA